MLKAIAQQKCWAFSFIFAKIIKTICFTITKITTPIMRETVIHECVWV